MKNTIQWTILIILIAVSFISVYTTYNKVTDVMDRQQNKIELLQEENAALTDIVWNLNDQLRKEDVE